MKPILKTGAKTFFDAFSIKTDLKQGVALSSLLSKFSLVYTIREVPEKQWVVLKFNGAHQIIVCVHHVNFLGERYIQQRITQKFY
jgi:hypothetical protein